MPKSWTEKYYNGKDPIVGLTNRKISGFPAGSRMLVPTPTQVDNYIRQIPVGETRTTAQMAIDLAEKAGADLTCPLCCGLFFRICTERAYEELQNGKLDEEVTPFWRLVPSNKSLLGKISCGVDFIEAKQREEDHQSMRDGPTKYPDFKNWEIN